MTPVRASIAVATTSGRANRVVIVDHDASGFLVRDGRKVSVLAGVEPSADLTEQVTT